MRAFEALETLAGEGVLNGVAGASIQTRVAEARALCRSTQAQSVSTITDPANRKLHVKLFSKLAENLFTITLTQRYCHVLCSVDVTIFFVDHCFYTLFTTINV